MPTPLLSVCLITYNHEKYIRQAIEGVLMQKVNFDWELIIADDFSTDGTRAILQEYQQQHPNHIRLILQEKNVGAAQNWFDLMKTPTSKYIAYFEGDDHWIDDCKLQKQVDFLEQNPTFTLCHSDVQVVDIAGKSIENHPLKYWNAKHPILDYRFAIFTPIAFSCTSVFSNVVSFDKLSKNVKAGDWMLWILLTLKGNAQYFDQKFSAYRIGSGVSDSSVWHKDFHYRVLFLLQQMSIKNSFSKNKWLLKGSVYFMLFQWSKITRIRKFIYLADQIKYIG
ncbi:glycosyltransferase [Flavobacterium sp.]|uniref:glycosyltransferase n=1 Tax=Flavobacterium sp. TaxID=239 RepID=UPI00286A05C3|nr:glycosyltransferase [Flavobacterium sp.]